MSTITIHQLEPDIAQQLEERAAQHGHTVELEIKAILKSVLAPKNSSNIDLATAINKRFADLGDFEIPALRYPLC
jgi:plasmid stability protein